MSMGRRQSTQPSLWVAHDEICPGPGHRFYETLNALLREAAFDRQAEALCAPYYETAHVPGRKSVAPGVSFHWRAERVERTFAHVCETGGARRTRLRAQATVLALSAAVRALLHWWHAHIRSRIGFSRAEELCHAAEHRILLRHASRCPAYTSSPWTVQRPFHPPLRVARRGRSPVETRGWKGCGGESSADVQAGNARYIGEASDTSDNYYGMAGCLRGIRGLATRP
jgi:hypothetical protein